MSFLVAIDGPAGSGKGTIAKTIAKKLNFVSIDTGAMYRCVALYFLEHKIDLNNQEQVANALQQIQVDLQYDDQEHPKVLLNGADVTQAIREKTVSACVSAVSSIREVRLKLIELQREMSKGKKVIMEGRDITTVVFPQADLKIYMDAAVETRAQRRYEEMKVKDPHISYEYVLDSIKKRDKMDREKSFGALKMAPDAILIDTTHLTIEETLQKMIDLIEEKLSQK